MKTLKFLLVVCIVMGFSALKLSAQSSVFKIDGFPYYTKAMSEPVSGLWVCETSFSGKNEIVKIELNGKGLSGKEYQIIIDQETKYHGKNDEDQTIKQEIFISCEGIPIFRINVLIQGRTDETGELTESIKQYKVENL